MHSLSRKSLSIRLLNRNSQNMVTCRTVIRIFTVLIALVILHLPMLLVYLKISKFDEHRTWVAILFILNDVSALQFLFLACTKIQKGAWIIFLSLLNFLFMCFYLSKIIYFSANNPTNYTWAMCLFFTALQGFQLFYLIVIPFLRQGFSVYYIKLALPLVILSLITAATYSAIEAAQEGSPAVKFLMLSGFIAFLGAVLLSAKVLSHVKFSPQASRASILLAKALKIAYFVVYPLAVGYWMYATRQKSLLHEWSIMTFLLLGWTASGSVGWSMGKLLEYLGIVEWGVDVVINLWYYPIITEEVVPINEDVYAFLESFLLFSHNSTPIRSTTMVETDFEEPHEYAKRRSLERVPSSLFKDSTCSICMEEFLEGQNLVSVKVCNHAFHSHCLKDWAINRGLCPLCRAKIKKDLFITRNPAHGRAHSAVV